MMHPGWRNFIIEKLHLNQINIPGTHDSGTYAVDVAGLSIINSFRKWWGKTQELDNERLLHGIRFFDIRIETNKDKEIYVTHERFDCTNKKLVINIF